jgi:hypothetical protein
MQDIVKEMRRFSGRYNTNSIRKDLVLSTTKKKKNDRKKKKKRQTARRGCVQI